MSWLLNLLGLAWKSELDEYKKDCIALEAENMRLDQDVYRLEMNLKSSDSQIKVLRSDNAMLRDQVADLELDDEDEEDFDDDFDDDDDDYDEEEYYDDDEGDDE